MSVCVSECNNGADSCGGLSIRCFHASAHLDNDDEDGRMKKIKTSTSGTSWEMALFFRPWPGTGNDSIAAFISTWTCLNFTRPL